MEGISMDTPSFSQMAFSHTRPSTTFKGQGQKEAKSTDCVSDNLGSFWSCAWNFGANSKKVLKYSCTYYHFSTNVNIHSIAFHSDPPEKSGNGHTHWWLLALYYLRTGFLALSQALPKPWHIGVDAPDSRLIVREKNSYFAIQISFQNGNNQPEIQCTIACWSSVCCVCLFWWSVAFGNVRDGIYHQFVQTIAKWCHQSQLLVQPNLMCGAWLCCCTQHQKWGHPTYVDFALFFYPLL